MTRIAVGGFLHETNTFAPTKATYDSFVHGGGWPSMVKGKDVLTIRNINVGLAGFIGAATGDCPISGSGFYAPKHDPFVFLQDVAGNPPAESTTACAAHMKPLTALSADLAAGALARYVFITPDLCHDMHGASGCPSGNVIKAGDDWLKQNVPPLLAFANAHAGVVFVVWDEGDASGHLPFLALGPAVKSAYAGARTYTHSSVLKTVEEILGLPILPTVTAAEDLSDLLQPGALPGQR